MNDILKINLRIYIKSEDVYKIHTKTDMRNIHLLHLQADSLRLALPGKSLINISGSISITSRFSQTFKLGIMPNFHKLFHGIEKRKHTPTYFEEPV